MISGYACEKLNAEYPVLTIDATGRIVFSSPKDMAVTKAVLSGSTIVAGGIGFASAGATAAATIVATNAASVAATTTAAAAAATVMAETGMILTTVKMAITGIGTTVGTLIGGPFGAALGYGASSVASATTTTGTVTVAAPTLLSTPAWVALSGPVGWTLAGIGVLVVPFAWRLSKLKQKDKIDAEAQKQIKEIFEGIRIDRITVLREMGISILKGFQNNLDNKIKQLDDALDDAKTNRPSETELTVLKQQYEKINRLIAQSLEWIRDRSQCSAGID